VTENRQFHKFIIIMIIIPYAHDSVIRRENALGAPVRSPSSSTIRDFKPLRREKAVTVRVAAYLAVVLVAQLPHASFSRSFLRSAEILMQNGAILRNTLRMLNRQTPCGGNVMQSSETLRNSLGLNLQIRCCIQLSYGRKLFCGSTASSLDYRG